MFLCALRRKDTHYVMLGYNRKTGEIKGVLEKLGFLTLLDLVRFLLAESQDFQCN